MYKFFLKRAMDFIIAFLAFCLLSPIFLLTTLALFLVHGGNPFFFQRRPGYKERVFKIFKFKTMTDARNALGELLPDEQRITPVGNLVRKLSLDEIPQLLNVLKGDMSLVGPRPLLVEYLPLYNERQAKRHEVKPGITGWAQVNGRNTIDWPTKFEMDVWYVEHLSFLLDVKILFLTLKKVFIREGISASGVATMEKFKGNS